MALSVGDGVEHDLLALIARVRSHHGQRATVGRPDDAFVRAHRALVDPAVLPTAQVQQPQRTAEIAVGQPTAIGRGRQIEALGAAVAGQRLAGAAAVGGKAPDLVLAGGIADGVEPAPVGTDNRIARPAAFRQRRLDPAKRAGAGERHAPACGQRDPAAVCGHARTVEEGQRPVQPARAPRCGVGRQCQREHTIVAAGEVVAGDVGTALVDDAPIAQLRTAHLEIAMRGELARIAAIGIEGPQIGHAVGIADDVQAALPPHRPRQRADVVGGQAHGFAGAGIEAPQLAAGATAVLARVVLGYGQAETDEVQPPLVVVRRLARIGQRQFAPGQRVGMHRMQGPRPGRPHALVSGVEHLALRRPALHQHAPALEAQALGHATGQRHHIGLGGAVVVGRIGQPGAVRGDRGLGLVGRMAGQAPGLATVDARQPQVAFRGEHQMRTVQSGIAVIAGHRRRRPAQQQAEQRQQAPGSQAQGPRAQRR
ncbi:hypothetical protein BEN78_07480 [Xanthomonas citri pv. mangiferaeindicae]|nr:hypothetical protein BEN78_07480 [Xanthomonas citri pv. mangiferaeindicae]